MVDLSSIQEAAALRGLAQADLRTLASIAQEREIRQGERLITQGEETETFYIVRTGRVALMVRLRVLDSMVELAVEKLGALDAFGWSALVAPYRSIYSARCTEDGVVIAFPAQELKALAEANSSVGYRLTANLSELIGDRVRTLQQLWLEEIEQHMDRVKHWMARAI
jgi:CRP-like cAMP-binding protein